MSTIDIPTCSDVNDNSNQNYGIDCDNNNWRTANTSCTTTDDDDALLRPFEWLTSSTSLKPHILKGLRDINQQQQQESQSKDYSGNNDMTCDANNYATNYNNKVLHIGCGSSVLGEHLLEDNDYNVSYVLNIDYDQDILDRMEQRWNKKKQMATTSTIQNKELVFQQCELTDRTTKIIAADNSFDLIIDKSTLDCLLCSPTESVTAFLTEVYRLMNATTGVYICITFHSIQFMIPILQDLPGAEWDVTYEIIPRQSENLNDYVSTNTVPIITTTTTTTTTTTNTVTPVVSSIDGPDLDDKFKTFKVITCRRRRRHPHDAVTEHLDWDDVCDHVQRTSNEWFQQEHPFLTDERVEEIHTIFQNSTELSLREVYDQCFTINEKEHYFYEDDFLSDWETFYNEKLVRNTKDNSNSEGDDRYSTYMNAETFILFLKEMQ